MLLNFKGFTSHQCQSNIFRVFVNFALFLSSLSSLCFGQIVATSARSYHHTIDGNESESERVSANFPPNIKPEIVLGGLFPVHSKNGSARGPLTCGSLNAERGIHRLEAMIFAVDQINRDPNLLSNITLGMLAYDTCGWYTRALEESLEFVRESITKTADPTSCDPVQRPRRLRPCQRKTEYWPELSAPRQVPSPFKSRIFYDCSVCRKSVTRPPRPT
ncbi:Receptor ligand binding region [Desmophyllum pertusum]|uniref:Receptor ligand binding region n=1 Tax=Desmophyllum pertusum TaxID=174260 RepID=A0A9W9ZB76_9CNID|nr:Receptor ligand binding region [Desmophyllum pertusum]